MNGEDDKGICSVSKAEIDVVNLMNDRGAAWKMHSVIQATALVEQFIFDAA
ncbi:MAG: hypothetical protein KDJ34_06180 [Candidatus Competibacteraceae bacterium]|nr:hypothetical protein [Candidatus Competibacteraceae bacterium]